MEVCRLCLDLVATQGEAKLFDGETRDMVQVVAPELNLEASKEPHACAECQRTLTRLFEFKSRVFEREAEVRAAVGTRRGKFGLKEALEGGDAKGTPSATTDPGGGDAPPKAKDRVCRTCLAPIECESFTVLRPSEPDAYLSSMLDVCLVEVDLELTLDPVMCEACLEQLQRLHHFRSACRDVEEKIVAFREGGGAGAGPVDLHAVLGAAAAAAPDVEMVTVKEEDEGAASSSRAVPRRGGRKRVKVEPAKVEPVKEEEEDEEDDESEEEEDDEDEDMSEGDEDDPDDELKQEELDIKSETGTSDSDREFEVQNQGADTEGRNKKIFQCPLCTHKTFRKEFLNGHIKWRHENPKDKIRTVQRCDSCSFVGNSRSAFAHHQVKVHNDTSIPIYKCDKCDYSTCRRPHLKRHKWRLHEHRGSFTCEFCDYFSHNKNLFKQHLHLKHSVIDEEPLKCPQCPYVTFISCSLTAHMKVHGKGRFKCQKCAVESNTQRELVKHQIDCHDYELPFKCSKCDFRSHLKQAVKRHERTVHRDAPKFSCQFCKQGFNSLPPFRMHLLKMHEFKDVEPFKCSQCEYFSFYRDVFIKHANNQHKDEGKLVALKRNKKNKKGERKDEEEERLILNEYCD